MTDTSIHPGEDLERPEPEDPGDLLEVSPEERQDVDPDPIDEPEHAALSNGADDLSDAPEGDDEDEDTDESELQE